jgi:hypothetical protein
LWYDWNHGGAWLEPDLALMLRQRDLVCKTVDAQPTAATAYVLDVVQVIDHRRYRVATLLGEGYGWSMEVGGFVRTADGLWARSVYSNEYWRIHVFELTYDEQWLRDYLETAGVDYSSPLNPDTPPPGGDG